MTNTAADLLLFVVLPYVAVALCVVGTIERVLKHPYSISSGSTQLLENRGHFWSIVPFHYGIILVLIAHVVALATPQVILNWNASPARLYLLEIAGLALGLLALVGFTGVFVRRMAVASVRVTTRAADWIVYVVLLTQLATGVFVAAAYPWGSSWSASVLAPYLASLVMLQPDITIVSALPLGIKLHVAGAFVLIGAFPFSRLVHVVSVPNAYFWRRPQVVRWYRPHKPAVEG